VTPIQASESLLWVIGASLHNAVQRPRVINHRIECAIALDLINIKETHMKSITSIKQVVFATLLLSATVTAFAAGGGANGLGRNPNLYASLLTSSTSHSPQTALATSAGSESLALATGTNGPSTADRTTGYGKTRAQVQTELLEAERAGTVPIHKNEYPPSVETLARNQVRFQQIEQAWRGKDPVVANNQ
jgi:hypothetical protein